MVAFCCACAERTSKNAVPALQGKGKNMDLSGWMRSFEEVARAYEHAMERHGLSFEDDESSPRSRRFSFDGMRGCHCENGGASIWRNWISPACLACREGKETGSLFVDLRCTKSCYFCFNVNQPHFKHFQKHRRNIVLELEQAHASDANYRCLAVTGGEPLLNEDDVIAFFRRAKELYPHCHTRLYTNGELLNDRNLERLAESGLAEIRFSVKPRDFDSRQEHVLYTMEKAVAALPNVVIEMPVIPGSADEMKSLMRRADAIGVKGMNLFELCFPLHNSEEFRKRGMKLRKHPFNYLYGYWYGGGVPVARSEKEALGLLEFAENEQLCIGIHYCSADNRNSAQVCLQNAPFENEESVRRHYAWLELDENDHFLKCAKAFGADAQLVAAWAEKRGDVPYDFNEKNAVCAVPLRCAEQVRAELPWVQLGRSVALLEERDAALSLREVALEPLEG